ncbi:MAG: Tat pathway signal protein [Phenylobacterium sp.]|jgi:hypothetical protein|uniref:Tat pathway signal protein n=1 Tax=Phenylobacterium sp. TaxID=1871053 RepID=UPI00391D5864
MDRRKALALAAGLSALPALAAAADAEPKAKGGGSSYLPIQTLAATVTRSDGRRGVLTLDVGLDIPDAKLRREAELVVPRLRAGLAQVLQTYAGGISPTTPPNADFVARELQREADRVLGRPGARLLLGTMLIN